MKKRLLQLITVGIFSFFVLSSFQEEDKKPVDRIRAEINKKLDTYRKAEERRCRDRMFEQAALLADSILMARSRSKAIDTLVKPAIPLRPDRPEVLFPKDSTPVAPFLEADSLIIDTLYQDTLNQ